jgi:hypothetical protein
MLRELYDGKSIPGEGLNDKAADNAKIVARIDKAVKYLLGVLSPADAEKFQELPKLYAELSVSTEREIFVHGFSMGVAVMVDVNDQVKAMGFLQKTE